MQHLLRWGCIAILPSKMSIATRRIRRSAISSLPISLPTDFSPLCLMFVLFILICALQNSSPSRPLRLSRSAPARLGEVGDPTTLGALGFRGGPAVLEELGTAWVRESPSMWSLVPRLQIFRRSLFFVIQISSIMFNHCWVFAPLPVKAGIQRILMTPNDQNCRVTQQKHRNRVTGSSPCRTTWPVASSGQQSTTENLNFQCILV